MHADMTTVQRLVYDEARRDAKREEPGIIRASHAERCATQGHELEDCCSAFFRVFRRCRWCGDEQ
jgi:hypothetical protein